MRKARSDSRKTRGRILRHATEEFAAKGYDGARVDSIASRCRLSKNMLYHYFGSKEGMFIEVLEQMYEMLRTRQDDFSIRGTDPVEGMRQLMTELILMYCQNGAAGATRRQPRRRR